MKTYTWKISSAVACAMNFDEQELRVSYVGSATVKRLRNGYRITGTLEQLKTLAFHMTREEGWDLSPSTIYACNQTAKKLREFIADKLREERTHTIVSINNGTLKVSVHCSCGWSCGRDTTKLAKAAHSDHAITQGATP